MRPKKTWTPLTAKQRGLGRALAQRQFVSGNSVEKLRPCKVYVGLVNPPLVRNHSQRIHAPRPCIFKTSLMVKSAFKLHHLGRRGFLRRRSSARRRRFPRQKLV